MDYGNYTAAIQTIARTARNPNRAHSTALLKRVFTLGITFEEQKSNSLAIPMGTLIKVGRCWLTPGFRS